MNIAILLAAGNGTRMKTTQPKQFQSINGLPLFAYSLLTFHQHPFIDSIIIVTQNSYQKRLSAWVKKHHFDKVKKVIVGGNSRQESVYLGLQSITFWAKTDDIVLIHDAARPFVSASLIDKHIQLHDRSFAVNTVIPVTDTILSSKDGEHLDAVLNRNELYQVQTPQSFHYGTLYQAHQKAKELQITNASDDIQLMSLMNISVSLVLGEQENMKITYPQDILLMKVILKEKQKNRRVNDGK